MDKKTAGRVASMIEKECCRNSLTDLCEHWDVSCDDFEEFIAGGLAAAEVDK